MRDRQHFCLGAGLFVLILVIGGCGSASETQPAKSCAPKTLLASGTSGNTGKGRVFIPDPLSASNLLSLLPTSSRLNEYTTVVPLAHLTGRGVLESKYVQVQNGLDCNSDFGAYAADNQFVYPHQDRRFQEVMTYYFGDTYQSNLDSLGYLRSKSAVVMVAHCENRDNAYFEPQKSSGGTVYGRVCLGDSRKTPGAFYSDDAMVSVHELQHFNTSDNYSKTHDLNQLFYDEAGALNEGISDFMGLIFSETVELPSFSLDSRVFSRWALGKFDPKISLTRGSHRCPVYDSDYPNCNKFPSFEFATQGNGNISSVSFVYPDGMGWPYPSYYKGANPGQQVYENYPNQEEIHDAAVILTGALWDAYTGVKKNHPEDPLFSYRMMSKAVMETIRNLPIPNSATNVSPINFIGFSKTLLKIVGLMPEFTTADVNAISDGLKIRGLHDYPELTANDWLSIGSGTNIYLSNTSTPGVRIQDNPSVLQDWLDSIRSRTVIPQDISTGLNSRLDPGEVVAIWFDLKNTMDITAGGVLVQITLSDSDVTILNGGTNIGYLSQAQDNSTQIMYGKVNGNNIAKILNPDSTSSGVGNTYFRTNPLFDQSLTTAVWVRANVTTPHGKVINFQVTATPSNGVASTKVFPVTIN